MPRLPAKTAQFKNPSYGQERPELGPWGGRGVGCGGYFKLGLPKSEPGFDASTPLSTHQASFHSCRALSPSVKGSQSPLLSSETHGAPV